jgi:hypothetical protein
MTIYDPFDFIIGCGGITAGVVGIIFMAATGVLGNYDYILYWSWIPFAIFDIGAVIACIVTISVNIREHRFEEV